MSRWKFRMCVKAAAFSFSLLQTVIISGCSSTKELNSESLSGTYIVDGRADKWNGKKMLDLKDTGLLVGVQNNASNVYVCIMSTDRTTERRMTGAGMIVWIEPENGKKFGIHYPLQMDRSSVAEGASSSGYRTEMEILGPEKDAVTQSSILTSESDYGIAAAFRDSSGLAVLELKIPRKAKQEPYGAGTDNTLSMSIESGKIEGPSGGKRQGESMGGGGRRRHGGSTPNGETPPAGGSMPGNEGTHGGGYSGGGGGNSGGRSGEGRTSPEPISLSLRVHLAQ
ncbi:MAG: hypothetical protein ABSA44_12970 [Bacteroidota bacterium]|jgi:hypothetical protein